MPLNLLNIRSRTTLAAAVLLAGGVSPLFAQDQEQMELGRQVFTEIAEPQCGVCHILKDAGASGALGPNLDTMAPSEDQVRIAVTQGVGVMPAFADTLSEEEIDAVATYVSNAASGN